MTATASASSTRSQTTRDRTVRQRRDTVGFTCPVCDHLSGQDQGTPCSMCMDAIFYGLIDAPFLGQNLTEDIDVRLETR